MKISRVVLGIIIVWLTILGSGVMQAEGTAKIQVPMHGMGHRPHSPSEDILELQCYISDGTLYLEIEDFSGMIYVELQTLDGRCVHREYYYYTNPYTISTSSLHGWGGRSNGYFNPDVFDPREGVSYDTYPSISGENFKYDIQYIPFYQEQMTIL